jgi:exodeoxyribonuclease V beta subunit
MTVDQRNVASFDLTGALPSGRLALEASAGTGKTYTVAALVTRLVAEEGVDVSEILVTTFTRAAAQELRDRIRRRLIETAEHLGDLAKPTDDLLTTFLRRGSPSEQASRKARLDRAVSAFDTATISTIHSLCQRLLQMAGRPVQLSPDDMTADRIVAEVVNDHLVALGIREGKKYDAKRIATTVLYALGNPTAELWIPEGRTDGKKPTKKEKDVAEILPLIRSCVGDATERMAQRPGFDTLLRLATETIAHPDHGDVRDAIRRQFRVAVVDEAQDTDPLQWRLLEALYPPDGEGRLVIVGDPKQSIYAFRGANVQAYIAARAPATQYSLDVNWRSDEGVLTVLNALFRDASFGRDIDYRLVKTAPGHEESRMVGSTPAVDIICRVEPAPAEEEGGSADAMDATEEEAPIGDVVTHFVESMSNDVTQVVVSLLSDLRLKDPQDSDRALMPSDIAVLVETNWEGAMIVAKLLSLGVPAVSRGADSVLASDAGTEWDALARALVRPASQADARRVAIGWFGNQRHEDLLTAEDPALRVMAEERLIAIQEELSEWAALLRKRGVAALVRRLLERDSTLQRMSSYGHGERNLADFQHVAELLHAETAQRGIAPEDLVVALDTLRQLDKQNELVARRTESDAAAVQVLTIHSAKGLEFPVVLVPASWDPPKGTARGPAVFHPDPTRPERRLDVSYAAGVKHGPSYQAMQADQFAEEFRLLYVAATRAKHHLVLWLPMGETALASAASHAFGITEVPDSTAALHQLFTARDARVGPLLRVRTVEEVCATETPEWEYDAAEVNLDALVTAPAPARVRQTFRRLSFSELVKGSQPEGGMVGRASDEFLDAGAPARNDVAADAAGGTSAGRLATLPAGAEFGSMLHDILEVVDPGSPMLAEELAAAVARSADTPALRPRHADLVGGLDAALRTPLGPIANGLSLAELPPRSILAELSFDLTLADRDRGIEASAIGKLLLDHLPSTDPLHRYAARLARPIFRVPLGGLLTGSIDAVIRLPETPERILIADYKSNRLDSGFHQTALQREMSHHHYPLQGLLYLAAIHRFLRWRTGEADPSARIAGFAYLFLRGMVGPDTTRGADGTPDGVFAWTPPPGFVGALSDLLAGEVAR